MSWDIYGESLRRGHCEVHPHVHEEYPCSVCIREAQQNEAESQAYEKAMSEEYEKYCAAEYEAYINKELGIGMHGEGI